MGRAWKVPVVVVVALAACVEDRAPTPAPQRVCVGAGFCWEHPLPQGSRLRALWAPSPTEAWAGGAGGTLLRFGGARWDLVSLRDAGEITAISGSSASDVWVAGSGGLRHFDGHDWTTPAWDGAPITDVRAEADGKALGLAGGKLVSWDGATWSEFSPAPPVQAISAFARGGDELWISSPAGVFHFRGAWERIIGVATASGFSPVTGAVVATAGGDLLRLQGAAWKVLAHVDDGTLVSPARLSDGEIWAVQVDAAQEHSKLVRWRSGALEPVETPIVDPMAISARGMNDVWVASATGQLGHFEGLHWDATPAPATRDVRELFAASDDDVWAAGDGLAHWNGRAWEAVADGRGAVLRAISGTSASDVWAVGDHGLSLHFGGHAWSTFPVDSSMDFQDVVSLGGSVAWAVAGGHALRFAGTKWEIDDPPGSPALDAIGAIDELVLAGTADGRAFRHTAGGWEEVHTAGISGIQRVVVRGVSEALAVTPEGLAMYDGSRLALWAPSTTALCGRPVHEADVELVFGCESGAPVMRWDGAAWSQLDTGIPLAMRAIARTTSGDLWIGGADGALLRRFTP